MINVNYSNRNVYKYTKATGICPDNLIGSDDVLNKIIHLIKMGNYTKDGFLSDDEALDLLDKEMELTKHSIQYIHLELLAELEDAGFFILRKSEENLVTELMERSAVVKEHMTLKMREDLMREANIDQGKMVEIIMKNYLETEK